MTLFFTSDLHLGSEGLARWRRFPDVAAHDEAIIQGINARVDSSDELWILGDACHPNLASVERMRESIICGHVHMIIGNHDKRSLFETLMREKGLFESVGSYAEVGKVARQGYKLCLSHYPMLDWNRAVHGSYMLHGHIHSQPGDDEESAPSGLPITAPAMEGRPRDGSNHGMGMRGYNELCARRGLRRFDVGVDANGYAPVSIEEIMDYLPDDRTQRELLGIPEGVY